MAIAAQRFKMLDEETNVAVTNFRGLADNNVLNRTAAEVLEMTAQLNALLNNFVDGLQGKIKSLLDDLLSRLSIDGLGDFLKNLGIDIRGLKQFAESLMGIWDNLKGIRDSLKRLKDIDFLGMFLEAMLESLGDFIAAHTDHQEGLCPDKGNGGGSASNAQKGVATSLLASAALCDYKPGDATFLANLLPEGMVSDFINKLFNIANRKGLLLPLLDILDNDFTRLLLNGRGAKDLAYTLLGALPENDMRDPIKAIAMNDRLRTNLPRYDENWDKTSISFIDYFNGEPTYFDFASVRNRGYLVEGSNWKNYDYVTTAPFRNNTGALAMNDNVVKATPAFNDSVTNEQLVASGMVHKAQPIGKLIDSELLGYNA